jgi:aryl-alcohol dehydrogenase-like predicted oxidoreductase
MRVDVGPIEADAYGRQLYSAAEDADRKVVDRVGEIAAARGLPRAKVALAWLLSKPVVTAPIVGATKPQHLEDAVAALGVKLADEEIAALDATYAPHPVAGI